MSGSANGQAIAQLVARLYSWTDDFCPRSARSLIMGVAAGYVGIEKEAKKACEDALESDELINSLADKVLATLIDIEEVWNAS